HAALPALLWRRYPTSSGAPPDKTPAAAAPSRPERVLQSVDDKQSWPPQAGLGASARNNRSPSAHAARQIVNALILRLCRAGAITLTTGVGVKSTRLRASASRTLAMRAVSA